jgi:uncharacterized tellurite resistance protein B-like protein
MTISSQTQNMMRLLSQVILADGHIHASEIEALENGAQSLALSRNDGQRLSSEEIKSWFTGYLQELNEASSDVPKEIALTQLILSLADWPDKPAVVETLEKISCADAEFHFEEKVLISIVRAYWQYDGLSASGATIKI